MQELPHGLPLVQCGPFGFAPAAETCARKLLANIATHPARLRVAVHHPLLLLAELGVDRAHQQASATRLTKYHLMASPPLAALNAVRPGLIGYALFPNLIRIESPSSGKSAASFTLAVSLGQRLRAA
jgi:hypothetical protein